MAHPSSRRRRILTAAALVFALAAFPLGTAAIPQFSDVPDSNQFHNDIDAIADAGVTSGCAAGLYCPSAYVTREQMAAFMNRLGALAPEKTPVVNATTVDRFNADALSRVAYASTDNAGPDGSDGVKLTVAITAPTRGYFSVVASLDSTNYVADDAWFCYLTKDAAYITGTQRLFDFQVGANQEEDCVTNGVVSTCGGTSTFTLVIQDIGPSTSFRAGNLFVQFTPFNGTGGRPSLITCLI